MARVVVAHYHDAEAGVYRLELGEEVWEERARLDDEGRPVLNDNGEPVVEDVLIGYANVQDFVFAEDDERWSGVSREDIAKAQRRAVAKAQQPAPDPAPIPESATLPGVGEEL